MSSPSISGLVEHVIGRLDDGNRALECIVRRHRVHELIAIADRFERYVHEQYVESMLPKMKNDPSHGALLEDLADMVIEQLDGADILACVARSHIHHMLVVRDQFDRYVNAHIIERVSAVKRCTSFDTKTTYIAIGSDLKSITNLRYDTYDAVHRAHAFHNVEQSIQLRDDGSIWVTRHPRVPSPWPWTHYGKVFLQNEF